MKKIRTAFFIGLFSILSAASIFASESSQEATNSKKGIALTLPDSTTALDLGAKNIIMNNPIGAHYDKALGILKSQGLSNTVIMFNPWNNGNNNAILPTATQKKGAILYGFNTSEEGKKALTELANRYAAAYGENVDNWVIGNEINNNEYWNYMGPMDVKSYAAAYVDAFRVFYTAIKAKAANARVFYSVDYDWNYPKAGKLKYRAKELIDVINEIINDEGNIDWNLAYHPYPMPLTSANFWDDTASGQIKQDETTAVINFANLHVLTDYLKGQKFRNRAGDVRRVILSEQGFTSQSPGQAEDKELQAAAFAYAYYIADSDPYIDAFILSRQVDHPVETKDSLYLGLWTTDPNVKDRSKAMQRKKIWAVFKNIDNKNQTLSQTEFAKKIIGIQKWSDVIPNFKWKSME